MQTAPASSNLSGVLHGMCTTTQMYDNKIPSRVHDILCGCFLGYMGIFHPSSSDKWIFGDVTTFSFSKVRVLHSVGSVVDG
jgi:hypothetical protein